MKASYQILPKGKSQYLAPFDLQRALDTLKQYQRGLQPIREKLKRLEISVGTGWESVREKLSPSEEKVAEIGEAFADAYREQILLGHRQCKVFYSDDFDWTGLASAIASHTPSSPTFSKEYPLPLPVPQLAVISDDCHEIAQVKPLPNGDVVVVICSRRAFFLKESLERKHLSAQVDESLLQALGSFDSLIKVNRIFLQAFDTITVRPSLNRLEVRLDHPQTLDSDQSTQKSAQLFLALSSQFSQLTQLANTEVNLFPAIKSMYLDKNLGTIEKLSFGTDTASIKREIMRDKLDLREEIFHKGGIAQLGGPETIRPYAIKLHLKKLALADCSVKVSLLGNFRDLHSSAGASLFDAHIEGCRNESEFRAIINLLISYSTGESEANA